MIRGYKKLLKTVGNGRLFLFLLALRSPFSIASTVINAAFLQRAFDAVGRGDAAGLTAVCLTFGLACMCLFVYNGIIWSIYAPFAVRMEGKLRLKLYEKVASFSCERVERNTQAEWITRLNADVQMPFSQSSHLPHAACAAINIAVSSIILWLINPSVFGWVLLFAVPHIVTSQLLVARAMPRLNKKSLEATAENTGELTALITCADVAALYGGHDYLMKRFEQSSLALLRAKMRIHARHALNAALAILPFGMSGYFALLAVSGGWIANGLYTFGELTAAFQYRGGIMVSSMALINCLIAIQASMAGVRRLNEAFSE